MTTLTEEDRRALDYQAQQAKREASRVARNARLSGNPAAAQAVRDAWEPIVLWARERRQFAEPIDAPEEGACNDLLSLYP